MPVKIGIPGETSHLEHRVALIPQLVAEYVKLGCEVLLEPDAGLAAGYPNDLYKNITFIEKKRLLKCDVILKVTPSSDEEIGLLEPNTLVISFLFPSRHPQLIKKLQDKKITSFAMDLIPRLSRAQSMDALTSQATVAGYRAVLAAADITHRFFPMLTTAGGTIRPVNVLIIGTGVAGLQAIATARRLGAIVKAYDVRSTTKEQVQSLGAKMIDLGISAESTGGYARELSSEEKQKQQEALTQHLAQAEIIISTAQIPGKPAPLIITKAMVAQLSPGTVIVDIAAESGGNCELTKADTIVKHQEVSIYGPTNLPSMLAHDASFLYARNVLNFTKLIIQNGQININWEDEIISKSCVTHQGEIMSDVRKG